MLNYTVEERELQATECLRVGAAERGLLLALATKLAGSAEAGHDLYTESLLDCHDAIQRKGFTGSNYKFYILQAIKWGNVERQRREVRFTELPNMERQRREDIAVVDFDVPTIDRRTCEGYGYASGLTTSAPAEDGIDTLAAEVERELTGTYSPALVNAFKLHVAGSTYREIQTVMGPGHEFSWVRRKIVKMKEALRETFGQAWSNLDAAE